MRELMNADARSRASLMCYLTLSELVAFHVTGQWLRTDHLVESTRLWVDQNGHTAPWLERLLIARRAESIAMQMLLPSVPLFDPVEFIPVIYNSRRLLNHRTPGIDYVYRQCELAVSKVKRSTSS